MFTNCKTVKRIQYCDMRSIQNKSITILLLYINIRYSEKTPETKGVENFFVVLCTSYSREINIKHGLRRIFSFWLPLNTRSIPLWSLSNPGNKTIFRKMTQIKMHGIEVLQTPILGTVAACWTAGQQVELSILHQGHDS